MPDGARHRGIRVFCNEDSPFHEKFGRTEHATFVRWGEKWMESVDQPRRSVAALDRWHASLTEDDAEAILRGESSGPPLPADSRRRRAVTYLRGDEPAPERDQQHIADALRDGQRHGATGSRPARPEDLAGRGKFDRICRCGEVTRVHADALWTVLDALEATGHREVSLKTLRLAAARTIGG